MLTPKNARGRPVTQLCLALETFRRTDEGRIRDAKAFLAHFFPITNDGATDRLFVHLPKEIRADLLSSWGIRGKKSALRDDDEKVRATVTDALGAGDIDETIIEEGVTPEILIDWVPLDDWWSFWRGNAVPLPSVRKALAVARELSLFDERWFLEHLTLASQKLTGTDVICAALSKDQIVAWIHAVHESGDASPAGLVKALGWETILAKTAHEALLHVLDTLARQIGLAADEQKADAPKPAIVATKPTAAQADKPAADAPKPANAPKPAAEPSKRAEASKPAAEPPKPADAPKPTAEPSKPTPSEAKPAPAKAPEAAAAEATNGAPAKTPEPAATESSKAPAGAASAPEQPQTVDFSELPVVEMPPEDELEVELEPEPPPPPPARARSAEPSKPASVVVAAKPVPRAPPVEHLPSVIIEPDPPAPQSRQGQPPGVIVEPDPFASPAPTSTRPDPRALFGAPDAAPRDLPPMRPPAATLAGVGAPPPFQVTKPEVAIPSFEIPKEEDPPWAPPRAEPGDMGWDLVHGVKRPMSNNVQPRYNFDEEDDEPTSEIALPGDTRR